MSEEPVTVTTDGLHAASEYARSWEQAAERAERDQTVAVLAHGRRVADVGRVAPTADVAADLRRRSAQQ